MGNSHLVGAGLRPMALDTAQVASGNAFLTGELEKRDPTLNEPLTSVTWPRDIVAESGGGYVDFTSNYFVTYSTAGANQHGIISGETNMIPNIQANISKDLFPVFTWGNNIKVPFVDQQKMTQIGRSLDEVFDNGLRLNYQKALDQNVYFGFPEFNTFGLINNPGITATNAPAGAASSTLWSLKTPQEIMNDLNFVLFSAWGTSQYAIDGIPNHILLPPAQFAQIATEPVTTAGNVPILEYFKRYNIAAQNGVNVEIFPARQCIAAGTSSHDRMVAYRNDVKRVCFDLPVPLTRAMTAPDPRESAYLTNYIGLIGVVKFKYDQCAYYLDHI